MRFAEKAQVVLTNRVPYGTPLFILEHLWVLLTELSLNKQLLSERTLFDQDKVSAIAPGPSPARGEGRMDDGNSPARVAGEGSKNNAREPCRLQATIPPKLLLPSPLAGEGLGVRGARDCVFYAKGGNPSATKTSIGSG